MGQSNPQTPLVGAKPVCAICQTPAILRDAWAAWNPLRGRWELQATFDSYNCSQCDRETRDLKWHSSDAPNPDDARRVLNIVLASEY